MLQRICIKRECGKKRLDLLEMEVVPALIRIDFDQYYNATDEEKVIITRNTIIRAVKKVKTKGKFDYEMFCQDLQNVTEN